MNESAAVILLGHGSRVAEANAGLAGVAEQVSRLLGGRAVDTAFLQMAEPDLPSALERSIAAGHREIAVVPFFLFAGAHVREDIPAIVEEVSSRHPGVDIRVAEVLGGHPKLAQAAAERAQEVLP